MLNLLLSSWSYGEAGIGFQSQTIVELVRQESIQMGFSNISHQTLSEGFRCFEIWNIDLS